MQSFQSIDNILAHFFLMSFLFSIFLNVLKKFLKYEKLTVSIIIFRNGGYPMNSKQHHSIYGKVDCESCIACGICQLKASKLFEYDHDGIAFIKHDNNTGSIPLPEHEIEAFKEAYTHCPTGAIKRKNSPF